jgi:hypothetical protein
MLVKLVPCEEPKHTALVSLELCSDCTGEVLCTASKEGHPDLVFKMLEELIVTEEIFNSLHLSG